MFKQATDVINMTTGKDMMGNSVSMSLYTENTHLQHLLHPKTFAILVSSKISAGHPFYLTNPSRRGFPGQHSQGFGLVHDHSRWGHGRSKAVKFRFPVLKVLTESDFVCNDPQYLWPKQDLQHQTNYLRMFDSGHKSYVSCLKARCPDTSMAVTVRVPRTFAWKLSTQTQHLQELWH